MNKLIRLLYKCQIEMNEINRLNVLYYLLDELVADADVMNIVNYHLTEKGIDYLITFVVNFDDEKSFEDEDYNDEWDGSDLY